MTNPLFVFALESESAHHFDDRPTLYTGVGKVAAAYTLTRYLLTAPTKPDLVINCGTAGARDLTPGSLVQCHEFVQRDMDVTALGFPAYTTPFSPVPAILSSTGPRHASLSAAVCGTGDHFVTAWPDSAPFQVVDMEAYALAHVCAALNVPFMAIKYISDNADDAAHVDWGAALDRAARALRTACDGM